MALIQTVTYLRVETIPKELVPDEITIGLCVILGLIIISVHESTLDLRLMLECCEVCRLLCDTSHQMGKNYKSSSL